MLQYIFPWVQFSVLSCENAVTLWLCLQKHLVWVKNISCFGLKYLFDCQKNIFLLEQTLCHTYES